MSETRSTSHPTRPAATSVTVTGLVKRFGASNVAVDDISFEVEPGKLVTLLGPSGCGKTTTLRMLAGLERPDAGEIRVGDRVVSSSTSRIFLPPETRDMGMVFQSYAIWPHMTVFENVAFPLREKGTPKAQLRERVIAALEMVGLGAFAQRPAPLLSGGQQQRVALARALVGNPQVLLLDEPLSNLDAGLREQMRFEIRSMQVRLGITTIFVTHDQFEAMTLSDSVIVMNSGRIEQVGSPREVYELPATRYVMDFLGQVNHLPVRIRITDQVPVALIAGVEIAFPSGRQWRDGEEAVLAFRSESVLLRTDGGGVPGAVVAATYVGGAMEYVVRVEESSVRVRAPADSPLRVGSRVGLTVVPADARVWSKEMAPRSA